MTPNSRTVPHSPLPPGPGTSRLGLDDPLFPAKGGRPISRKRVDEIIKACAHEARIQRGNVSAHDLRRAFAREFLRNGGDMESLRQLLGHSSYAIVKRYCGTRERRRRREAPKVLSGGPPFGVMGGSYLLKKPRSRGRLGRRSCDTGSVNVGPINWGSYPGDMLEKVMAVLVAQDHRDVVRRTPSSGDGGVDLLIPDGDGWHGSRSHSVRGAKATGERVVRSARASVDESAGRARPASEALRTPSTAHLMANAAHPRTVLASGINRWTCSLHQLSTPSSAPMSAG